MAWDAKIHNETKPRGKRDPKSTRVQTHGKLIFLQDGKPKFWVDRPLKFQGHMQHIIDFYAKKGKTVVFTDIKWQQLGSDTWWRIPAWPDGTATS